MVCTRQLLLAWPPLGDDIWCCRDHLDAANLLFTTAVLPATPPSGDMSVSTYVAGVSPQQPNLKPGRRKVHQLFCQHALLMLGCTLSHLREEKLKYTCETMGKRAIVREGLYIAIYGFILLVALILLYKVPNFK
jgi:hypothetical protein